MDNNFKRYDVVLVNFGENTIDSEQAGTRPAVIIQNDTGNYYSKTTIVMPLSSKIKNPKQPTHTLIKRGRDKGLTKDSKLLIIMKRQKYEECIMQILENR